MSERSDLPRIKPDEQPSYLNSEAAQWGTAGGLLGGMLMGLGRTRGAVAALAWVPMALGTVFGAVKGEARMEREQKEGRIIKDPSFWNRGLVNGFFLGGFAAIPVQMLTHTTSWPTVLITGASMVVGSVVRKNSMQHDFDRSVALRDANLKAGAYQQMAQGLYINSVTPQEYQQMQHMQQNKSANIQSGTSAEKATSAGRS